MKHLLKQSWMYLFLSTISPVAFGHIATEHALSLNAGLLHMLSSPAHVFPLILVLFLVILLVRRKQVALLRRWIVNYLFRQ